MKTFKTKSFLMVCLISALLMFSLVAYSPAYADTKWSAIGILTTQVAGEEAKARYVEIDDFESHELCKKVVTAESQSEDYIGEGGTSHKLPAVQWNYDAHCIQKRL